MTNLPGGSGAEGPGRAAGGGGGGRRWFRKWQVAVAVGAILAAIGVLTAMSLGPQSTSYYYTVDEFRALGSGGYGRYVQVNGMLQPGVQWDPNQLQLQFKLAGPKGKTLPVIYNGPEPNPFEPGVTSVVVAGRLGTDGVFHATQLLVKCPSRYTAAPSSSTG